MRILNYLGFVVGAMAVISLAQGTEESSTGTSLRVQRLELVDSKGVSRGSLEVDAFGRAGFFLRAPPGESGTVSILAAADGRVGMLISRGDNAGLHAGLGSDGSVSLMLRGNADKPCVGMIVDASGNACVTYDGPEGGCTMEMGGGKGQLSGLKAKVSDSRLFIGVDPLSKSSGLRLLIGNSAGKVAFEAP